MKQLKRSLQAIAKDLKSLALRTEKMIKLLDKLEKGKAKTSVRKKTVAKIVVPKRVIPKKGKSPSATETVLKIITRSKKGVGTVAIQEKTGFKSRKIWDIVHRAGKEGKIKKVGRGIYIKA
jgi:hypothetical protein